MGNENGRESNHSNQLSADNSPPFASFISPARPVIKMLSEDLIGRNEWLQRLLKAIQ